MESVTASGERVVITAADTASGKLDPNDAAVKLPALGKIGFGGFQG
jgi:hypothetical protein